MLITRNFKLPRQKTVSLLHQLNTSGEQAVTIVMPSGISIADAETMLKNIPLIQSIPADVVKLAGGSLTGAFLFWGVTQKYLISPPFPLKEKYITSGYDVVPLLSMLKPENTIGIVLVRIGSYSIGICHGEKLIHHFTGTGLVHGRHRQGGSSSARFQRRRQDQTHHFLERVCEHAREKLEPYAKSMNYLVYGGARTTILQLQKQCPFLQRFDDQLLPPLLEIPDPKFSVLEKAVTDIWSSRITEWREQDL